jgi:hypothetical protein
MEGLVGKMEGYRKNQRESPAPAAFWEAFWGAGGDGLSPWFLRSEVFPQNVDSFANVLLSLLSLNHPEANLNFIATFLWCL